MKATYHLKLEILLLLTLFSGFQSFGNTHIDKVFANQNFRISHEQSLITMDICKNPWESFTISVTGEDIRQSPIVTLEIKASESIDLRVDVTDGVFVSSEYGILEKKVELKKNFTTVSFDFTSLIRDIYLEEEVYLLFYVNPGSKFKGEVAIRNFSLNELPFDENQEPLTDEGFNMFPSPAISYTMVEIPEGNFQSLSIYDINGREVQNDDISFYSGMTYRTDLQTLPNGYYTVRLSGQNKQLTEKLIIK